MKLREARRRKSYSAADLAEKAGVSAGTIYAIEAGREQAAPCCPAEVERTPLVAACELLSKFLHSRVVNRLARCLS